MNGNILLYKQGVFEKSDALHFSSAMQSTFS